MTLSFFFSPSLPFLPPSLSLPLFHQVMTIYGVQLVLAIDANVSEELLIIFWRFLYLSLCLTLSHLCHLFLYLFTNRFSSLYHCTSTCLQIVQLLVTPPVKRLARKPSSATLVYRLGSLHLLFIDHLVITSFLNEKYSLRMCSIFYFIHSFTHSLTHSFIYYYIFLISFLFFPVGSWRQQLQRLCLYS